MKNIYLLLLILPLLFGCNLNKNSYPKEQLTQEVVKLCKTEYDIDVKAKLNNHTLGVQTFVESLMNNDLSRTEEYKQVIENIFLCVRRICFSTDAEIKFFEISCIGKNLGYQAIMLGYIGDLKKIMLGGISRDDFFNRMLFDIKPAVKFFGEKRVRNLFADMNTKKIDKIISNNFIKGKTTLKDISSLFFLSLLELNMKETATFNIQNLKSIPLSSEDELFYCEVAEEYTAKPGFENKNFIFPSNFLNQYLIVVSVSNFNASIKKIYPLYKAGGEEKEIFPEEYKQYEDINAWEENNFFLEDIDLPQFLANQIARRIKNEVNIQVNKNKELNPLESKIPSIFVEGKSLPTDATLTLNFAWRDETLSLTKQNITDLSFDIFKQVCTKYSFFDFKELKLFDIIKNDLIGSITVDEAIFKKGSIWKEAFNFSD